MSYQPTLPGLFNVTSSPESAFGRMPCAGPDGLTTVRSGPALAPARRSASPGRKSLAPSAVATSLYRMLSEQGYSDAQLAGMTGLRTEGTCGPSFTGSSKSVDLSQSLANRLRDVTASLGATLYKQRWSLKATPSGVSLWQHAASAPRTSGNVSIGWPTPCQQDGPHGGPSQGTDRLPGAAALTGWPTPRCGGNPEGYGNADRPNGSRGRLEDTVPLAGWPTPLQSDASKQGKVSPRPGAMALPETAPLAGWVTPTQRDWRMSPHKDRAKGEQLDGQVHLAGWNTPSVGDGTGGKRPHSETTMTGQHPSGRKVNMGLASQVHIGFE